MLENLLKRAWGRRSFESLYDTFVILGDPSAVPLWKSPRWNEVAERITPFVGSLKRPSVASMTMNADGVADKKADLAWGLDLDRALTEFGQLESNNATLRCLLSLELWSPGRQHCDQRTTFPDCYLAVRNEGCVFQNVNPTFNPYVVLAVACDLPQAVRAEGRRLAIFLASATSALVSAEQTRPWGLRFDKTAYSNAIGDLMSVDVFKVGSAHNGIPSLEMLEGSWRPL